MENNTNKGGKIVLLIFLLICSGLGIAAFVMSLTRCKKDGFNFSDEEEVEKQQEEGCGIWCALP